MVVPPGLVQVRSANMADAATITSRQNPLQFVTDELKELRTKGVAPRLRVLEGEQKPVCIFDGKEVINLASNNYLGLTTHKALRKAALDAVKRYGAGAGAVRTIAGTMKLHIELEDRKSTRLNSSHSQISHAVFCLKKKNLSTTDIACLTREVML